jgi:periplasmic copper chaperone A
MLKPLYAALLLAGTGALLGACSQGGEAPAEETAPGENADLTITNGRMMLSPVAGNPAAVYFDIAYDGEGETTIASAYVAGAQRAELHDMAGAGGMMTMEQMPPLALQPGESASFEPGGKHVMAFDLSPELVAGGTTEVTLTLANGDKHSFDVPIQSAGDAR